MKTSREMNILHCTTITFSHTLAINYKYTLELSPAIYWPPPTENPNPICIWSGLSFGMTAESEKVSPLWLVSDRVEEMVPSSVILA
jgi:hypothetical protein